MMELGEGIDVGPNVHIVIALIIFYLSRFP